MTIQTAINAVNDALLAAVTNLVTAYAYPPDMLFDERSIMTYSGGGTLQTQDASFNKGLHNIIVDFIVFRKDLPRDMQLLMTDIDNVYAALVADSTFGDTISTFGSVECSPPIVSQFNGQDILILRFTIRNVKILT